MPKKYVLRPYPGADRDCPKCGVLGRVSRKYRAANWLIGRPECLRMWCLLCDAVWFTKTKDAA